MIELDPADWQGLRRLAVVHLYLGDAANYRRICHELITQFGNTNTPDIADSVATTCLLTTQDEDDLRLCERLENAVIAAHPTNDYEWFRGINALSDYRRGRFAASVKNAQQSQSDTKPALQAEALVIEAMAQQRLGNNEVAKKLLKDVVDLQQNVRVKDPKLWKTWVYWLGVDILRREAEEFINGNPTTTPQPNVEKK